MKTIKTFLTATFLLLLVFKLNGQTLPFNIEYTVDTTQQQSTVKTTYNSWDGPIGGIAPTGTYRILNIFINIIYNQSATNPVDDGSGITWPWPANSVSSVNEYLPNYLSDFADADFTDANSVHGYQTRQMYESSFGNMILLGDYIIVNVLESEIPIDGQSSDPSLYGNNYSTGSIISKAVALINANGGLSTVFDHNSITDFDYNIDDIADFTQIFLRNTSYLKRLDGSYKYYHGTLNIGSGTCCSVGSYGIQVGTSTLTTGRGTIQCVGAGDLANGSRIVTHEFCHQIFGGMEFHTSGGNHYGHSYKTTFMGLQGGYGLMGCYASGLVCVNGYERWRMHWVLPENYSFADANNWWILSNDPDNISNVIDADIEKADGNQSFILRDFITYGDAVRIKLPYKDAGASNQYLWLENHQVGNNDKLDYLLYSEQECRPMGTAGIYAYVQVGKDILSTTTPPPNNDVWPTNETDNLKIISAEGKWDYISEPTESLDCIYSGDEAPTELQYLPNPLSGYGDQEKHFIKDLDNKNFLIGGNHDDYDEDGNLVRIINDEFVYKKYFDQALTQLADSIPHLGDNLDAFHGNTEMNIGSNPSTANIITYYVSQPGGNITPKDPNRNTRHIYLSGLKITMTDLLDGTYHVEIVWDDYDVKNDVRWTGDIVLKEQLNLLTGNSILLDQNYTPNQKYRDPVSDFFAEPSIFTCEDGSEFSMQENSILVADNNSTLFLQAGCNFEMMDFSEITIKNGSMLVIEDGANLNMHEGATITVEPNGYICIDKNAIINFADNTSQIIIQSGAGVGKNPLLDITTTADCNDLCNLVSLVNVQFEPNDLTISQDEVFNGNQYIDGDVTILQGNKLTVSGEIKFLNQTNKIIVEAGAQLILNTSSSKITTGCTNNLWQGIDVLGDATASQLTAGAQGQVILKNATIENAACGIRAISATLFQGNFIYDYSTTGGIIKAKNTTFLNCGTAIEFYDYQNFNPYSNALIKNLSDFKNCTFKTDDNMYSNGWAPSRFIFLKSVQGIVFSGNTFINEAASSVSFLDRGYGIESIDASYNLIPLCLSQTIPCTSFKENSFTGLYYAIKAQNTNPLIPVTLRGNTFTDNFHSIEILGISNAIIKDNEIDVGSNIGSSTSDHLFDAYGIYLEGCTGYTIENNDLTTTHGGRFGIIIYNSGSKANLVFSNTFSFFERAACQAEGVNASKNIQGVTGTGLVFKCNTFTNNAFADIAITSGRIAKNQGYCFDNKTPAGNQFYTHGFFDNIIANTGVAPFTYYYHLYPSGNVTIPFVVEIPRKLGR